MIDWQHGARQEGVVYRVLPPTKAFISIFGIRAAIASSFMVHPTCKLVGCIQGRF